MDMWRIGIFADPFSDYTFKRLFGIERNKPLLIDFLNALLKPVKKIVNIQYLNVEKLGNTRKHRKSVFDIYCEDEDGNKFIIEIQKIQKPYFLGRTVFYSTFAVQEHAVRGKWDFNIKQTYAICILGFCFDNTYPDHVVHEVKLVDIQTQEIFDNNLTYCYLETPKFKKKEIELTSRLDIWLYVLNNLTTFTEIPDFLKDDPIFKQFFMEAKIANFNRDEMMAYYASMKDDWDRYSEREGAALDAKFAIAKLMKSENEPLEKIMKYTGLSAAEIENL